MWFKSEFDDTWSVYLIRRTSFHCKQATKNNSSAFSCPNVHIACSPLHSVSRDVAPGRCLSSSGYIYAYVYGKECRCNFFPYLRYYMLGYASPLGLRGFVKKHGYKLRSPARFGFFTRVFFPKRSKANFRDAESFQEKRWLVLQFIHLVVSISFISFGPNKGVVHSFLAYWILTHRVL